MNNIMTLSSIEEADLPKVGERAVDLSILHKNKFNIPLSFVIPNIMFHEFLLQNKLSIEIRKLLSLSNKTEDDYLDAYARIKTIFEYAKVPEEFHEELLEAYETFSYGSNHHDAQGLLEEDEPHANLIISPSYGWKIEGFNGILLNIKNFENFLNAMKTCWLSLYSPEQLKFRESHKIEEFTAGIIVQKFLPADTTVDACSKSILGNYELTIDAYFGLPDITGKLSKDSYSISRETFGLEHQEVRAQESILLQNSKSGTLIKRSLGQKGKSQKIIDKEIFEIARLIDKASVKLGRHIRLIIQFEKSKPNIFFADRICERNAESELQKEVTKKVELGSAQTLNDIINAPITEDDNIAVTDLKPEPKGPEAFAWESTLSSDTNPPTDTPINAILLPSTDPPIENLIADDKNKEDKAEEISQDTGNNPEDFIIAPQNNPQDKKEESFLKEEEQIKSMVKNEEPLSKNPDNQFFMSIISDLEPSLDQEIMKRYQAKFNEVPTDVTAAMNKLEEIDALPEKEQIFKLKSLKAMLERGETINLDVFLEVTEQLRRVFQ